MEKERLLILGSRMAHGVASCWAQMQSRDPKPGGSTGGGKPGGESRPAALAVSDRRGRSAVLRPPMPKGRNPDDKGEEGTGDGGGELRRFVPRWTRCCLDASVSSRSKAR